VRIATTTAGLAVVGADQSLVPLSALVPGSPGEMRAFIEAGETLWSHARAQAAKARGGTSASAMRLLAPIPLPRRDVFCVGWNYSDHFEEGRLVHGSAAPSELPEHPALFSKGPNTIIGSEAGVLFPSPHSTELDWEVELAVVIGRGGRDIDAADGLSHVFGYTVANDISVRDVQLHRHGGQWFKGKNFDTHLPMGPWIVTADEIPNPHSLHLGTRVNGIVKQDSSTRHMVFPIPRIIEELSAGLELVPGDLILTGTPPGVGFARTPPEFMRVGDVVEVEVEGVGKLRNPIVAPKS